MRSIIKTGLIFLSFLTLVIFPSSAISVKNNDTVVVSNLSENTTVEFIFNNGYPVFSRADSQGESRYVALSDGDINVIAISNGNVINSSNYTVNIVHLVEPGGGAGGGTGDGSGTGCGGVISKEPYGNILNSQMIDRTLVKNSTTKYSFDPSNFSIYEVIVTNDQSQDIWQDICLSIKIEHLKDTSKTATSTASGNIYANENIVSGKNVDNMIVRFKVDDSWINSKNIDKTEIKLYKYSGAWYPLDTNVINDDGTYTYFEVKNTGFAPFAPFAIGIETAGVPTAITKSTPAETPIPTPVATPLTTIPVTTKSPGFEIVIGIVTISTLYIYMRIRKIRKR